MIFVGKDKCDLSDPAIVEFVQKGTIGESLALFDEQTGFHKAKVPPIVLGKSHKDPKNPLFVVWSVSQRYSIFDHRNAPGGQLVQKVNLETFATREIEISGSIDLILRDGLTPEIEKKISDAFAEYIFPTSGDVDVFVAERLAKDTSIGPYDFGLSRSLTVYIAGNRVVDQTAYNAMMHPLVREERFSVRLISDQDHTTYRQLPPHPNNIPEQDIKKTAEARMPNNCDGMDTVVSRFATATWAPASRVTWSWELVNWGCVKFHFWKATTEFRDQELAAYLSVTFPRNIGQYAIDQVIDSANKAAVASIVVGIVFTDLSTAIATFNGMFYASIEQKFGRALECIGADLWVSTEYTSDWH